MAEVEVNEDEEEWMTEEESRRGDEGGDLDPEQVRQGREEEMTYMIKTLKMFDFGSWEYATSRTSKKPTTTKWVDRAKKDDNRKLFVRCRLVARERLKSEVVAMDKEYREKLLEAEEHVPFPKRVYISRENLEEFGFTAICPGCMSFLQGTARQAHMENCRRRIEEELKGTTKADAATKRTKTSKEEGHQQHEPEKPTARMEEDAPASSSSGGGNVLPAQRSSSSGSTTRMSDQNG